MAKVKEYNEDRVAAATHRVMRAGTEVFRGSELNCIVKAGLRRRAEKRSFTVERIHRSGESLDAA